MKTFDKSAINFFNSLKPDFDIPENISVLNPYANKDVQKIVKKFYSDFYNDTHERVFIFGINPGRFGSGTTGIAFTDPVQLEKVCKIDNTFHKKQELSSTFVYEVIKKYGGVDKFYGTFFVGAVCPLGFIKEGKNINYYDDKMLIRTSRQFIIDSMKKQMQFNINNQTAICLGEGKNFNYFNELNKEMNFFKTIVPLAHPRYIMQYQRKKMDVYIEKYIKVFKSIA